MSSDGASVTGGGVLGADFVAVFVMYKKEEPITRAGKVAVANYDDVDDLVTAVVATVRASERFTMYDRCQLAGGSLFVLEQPPGKPSHPGKVGLSIGPVKVKASDCILLDISASEFRFMFVPRFALTDVPPSLPRPHPPAFARPITPAPYICRRACWC